MENVQKLRKMEGMILIAEFADIKKLIIQGIKKLIRIDALFFLVKLNWFYCSRRTR